MNISVSEDGREYIIRIPRKEFTNLGGIPVIPTGLTPRQVEVLDLILVGKCNKEIAVALNITVRTVKHHVSELLRHRHVESRYQLVMVRENVAIETVGNVRR